MNTIRKGRIATAHECPSCDYVIPLAPFSQSFFAGVVLALAVVGLLI